MDWDDLRFVLAVGRTGTLSGAARQLRVNHSTVYRRIGAIEAKLGVRLFERHRDGYTLTPAGDEAVAMAEQLESGIEDLARQLAGRDLRPSGLVRIATTDTLMVGILAPAFAACRTAHPEIVLDVTADNRFASLSKRDADIAIRPTMAPPENLVGRRICSVATAIYGAESYLAVRDENTDLAAHDWIAPDESLDQLASARWLRALLKGRDPVLCGNSLLGLRAMAEAGLGLAALPCFLGDTAPGLRRVRPPLDDLASALWLLTHRDLRRVARIRAVMSVVGDTLTRRRDRLEGR